MIYLLYDGSLEGFFSAIFTVFDKKHSDAHIRKKDLCLPLMFAETEEVITHPEQSARVRKKIEELGGEEAITLLWKALLSGIGKIEDAMLGAIQYMLKAQCDILKDFGDPFVLELRQVEKKMRRERHRMTAFVRFQLGSDGLFYAFIEPDFDVLPLIISHFENRYADQRWLIYDSKRKYGIYYDLHETQFVKPEADKDQAAGRTLELKEEEEAYQLLWKAYFNSTNIKERKNMKLHLQHVPKRYWKYLVEKG